MPLLPLFKEAPLTVCAVCTTGEVLSASVPFVGCPDWTPEQPFTSAPLVGWVSWAGSSLFVLIPFSGILFFSSKFIMFSILPPYRRHISNLLLYPHLLLQSANLKAADLRVSFLSPCLQLRRDYDNFILKCFDEPFFIHELPTQGNGFFFLVNPCFCASSHASRFCLFGLSAMQLILLLSTFDFFYCKPKHSDIARCKIQLSIFL